MYLPKALEEGDVNVLHDFIEVNSFGTLVSTSETGVEANHMPFDLARHDGTHGTLRGHVSRQNPAWKLVSAGREVLVIFQGASAYVSPSHHPARKSHGKVAPSWNYSVVHAHGVARAIEQPSWILEHLGSLTSKHEAGRPEPWEMAEAPTSFIESAARHIIGIEVLLTRMVGKFQASQQYAEPARQELIRGLMLEPDANSTQVATMMASRRSMHS